MCRIAEVLISLQQVGHVQYIGWRMEFYCGGYLVEDLKEQAKKMEEELESWNRAVSQARKEFYELNYYTTHQLLVLRRELGELKSPGQALRLSQQAQVMALLETISNQITPAIVEKVVHQCRLLQVSLSVDILNENQLEHFTNIVCHFGYGERTALKAIEVVGDGDWSDVENWLMENGNEYEEMLQESEGEDDAEEVTEEEDNEMHSDASREENDEVLFHGNTPMLQEPAFPIPTMTGYVYIFSLDVVCMHSDYFCTEWMKLGSQLEMWRTNI